MIVLAYNQPHQLHKVIRAGLRGWPGLVMLTHNLTTIGSGTAIGELPVSCTRGGSARNDVRWAPVPIGPRDASIRIRRGGK